MNVRRLSTAAVAAGAAIALAMPRDVAAASAHPTAAPQTQPGTLNVRVSSPVSTTTPELQAQSIQPASVHDQTGQPARDGKTGTDRQKVRPARGRAHRPHLAAAHRRVQPADARTLKLAHRPKVHHKPKVHHPKVHHPEAHHPKVHHPEVHHPKAHHPKAHHPKAHHPKTHHPKTHHPKLHHPKAHHPKLRHGRARAVAHTAGDPSETIADFQFSPATVTIHVGDTITWTNNGPSSHTATAQNGSFNTGLLKQGASASHTFNQAGTFAYVCQIHPFMHGTVVVLASSTPAPAKSSPPATTSTPAPSAGAASGTAPGPAGQPTAASSSGPSLPMTGYALTGPLVCGIVLLGAGLGLRWGLARGTTDHLAEGSFSSIRPTARRG